MKAEIVFIAYDIDWEECSTIGAYSTLDNALNSCYSYIEHNYPETIWLWDGRESRLEQQDTERDIIIVKTVVDINSWEGKYEQ